MLVPSWKSFFCFFVPEMARGLHINYQQCHERPRHAPPPRFSAGTGRASVLIARHPTLPNSTQVHTNKGSRTIKKRKLGGKQGRWACLRVNGSVETKRDANNPIRGSAEQITHSALAGTRQGAPFPFPLPLLPSPSH